MLARMRARRSCLSVPARPAKMLDRGPGFNADEVVVDLEDSVTAELKDEGREAVVAALRERQWAAATVSVRINGVGTPWFADDVRAVAGLAGSVILPKAESAADVAAVERLLDDAGGDTAIEALIESARGLLGLHEIAASSPRLEALILGPADMSVSLGFPSPAEGPHWNHVRSSVLVAARAAGLQAIDGPFLNVADDAGLRASAGAARELGYDGKWAIHPDQVGVLEEAFSPTAAEVERAKSILAALSGDPARGAVALDGEMIDEASRKRAEQLLARAGAGSRSEAR